MHLSKDQKYVSKPAENRLNSYLVSIN